ncbi:hypothetical protein J1614_009035 [Plenodomus biglobosus]|nr:hypothetical protein J1614_009035 [Plenodomus biglobosus]
MCGLGRDCNPHFHLHHAWKLAEAFSEIQHRHASLPKQSALPRLLLFPDTHTLYRRTGHKQVRYKAGPQVEGVTKNLGFLLQYSATMAGRGGRNGFHRGGRSCGGGNHGAHNNTDRGVCYAFQRSGRLRAQETSEQQKSRQSYSAWKRLLNEASMDSHIMRRLWEGTLAILDEGDDDWTQQLARDLDEDERGRIHMRALLTTQLGHSLSDASLSNARHFLLSLTHPTLLRCLAVDTHVGSLYNFFGGVDGRTAIAFLGQVCKALVASPRDGADPETLKNIETTLGAMALAVFELLKRERRVRFNDAVSALIDSIQTATDSFRHSMEFTCATRIDKRLVDVRAMISRTQNLLADELSDDGGDGFDNVSRSVYPRDLIVPSDRHDNDKKDITKIIIFPTSEEIMSDAKEFLPFTDPDQLHFLDDPVQRHIDTYFRLARHDTFGELKGALAGVMHTVAQDPNALSNTKLNFGDMRTYQYPKAFISYVSLRGKKGLQAQISFLQPPSIRARSAEEKEKWWEESRRLEEGSLLTFVWVQDSAVRHMFLCVSEKVVDSKKEHGLADNDNMACITTSLVTQDLSTFHTLMEANANGSCGILLEFPKVMPATFVPILESLQAMQRLNRLPFKDWIIPNKVNDPSQSRTVADVPPPLYARTAGFKFPLQALTKARDASFYLDCSSSCDNETLLDKLEEKTDLDRGQCRALVAGLLREFAFIQGPPGTGKSYLGLQLMKVLLSVAKKADLGPILVVCYTNHALDQFLEHLLDIGFDKVIRMGGQSKSLKLRDHNLRSISKSEEKTKSEKYMASKTYKALEQSEKSSRSIFRALRDLEKWTGWDSIKSHIEEQYPTIYSQFREVDEEGFQTVGRHPFDLWRMEGSSSAQVSVTLSPTILRKANANVHSLDVNERATLLDHWFRQAREDKIGELFEIVSDITKTRSKLDKIHDESDRRVLQEADVIGVTTSGLARRISMLQNVKCKVVICEEAGEVMEPHMLSALLPDVEHCIQIGDREQLRPLVNNFRDLSSESESGKLHALDRSQFERLSVGQPGRPVMPVAQLNVQRRMRPQISTLIRETIYEKLVDHRSTFTLPDVVGLRKNVFWLDHRNFENGKDMEIQHAKSKSNTWEVDMVHALICHVVRQGVYKSEEIAVLTPYTGQLQKLRTAMRSSFEIVLSDRDRDALEKDGFDIEDSADAKKGAPETPDHRQKPLEKKTLSELLRVATVDNFQGEEAKVIIVSLVRSNEKRNVGFLKTSNRINVLLSRAQHGMYLIGNTETYSSVDMWQKVIDMLRANDSCCGMKPDEQPDMIMMTRYADLDLNESPIVVLGCGHFFTTETLDGHVGLKDVYKQDPMTGTFNSISETAELAPSIPQCPKCRSPVRQYVTQRYNRAINRGVIDEISKRYIVNGQQQLQQMEIKLRKLESSLNKSRKFLFPASKSGLDIAKTLDHVFAGRYGEAINLINDILALQRSMATQHEPAQKLHQAIVYAKSQDSSLKAAMRNLSIDSSMAASPGPSDLRVTYGARLLEIKVRGLLLEEKFEVASNIRSNFPNSQTSLNFRGGSITEKAGLYLDSCQKLVADCIAESLPKIAVEATLYYARIAQLFGSSGLAADTDRANAKAYRDTSKHLLKDAKQLCENKFRDSDALHQAIVYTTEMLSKDFYETVSKAEMDMIKQAMVSGKGDIATHSGHWYKCAKGHPFAVGECGMPMELARCPECGNPVGGQNHTPTAGVTRAENMEH